MEKEQRITIFINQTFIAQFINIYANYIKILFSYIIRNGILTEKCTL